MRADAPFKSSKPSTVGERLAFGCREASATAPLPLMESSTLVTWLESTELSAATSPGRTRPRKVTVWRSLPTVKSRTASTTKTPLGSTSTTRPERLNWRLELMVEAPLPSSAVVELALNMFCRALLGPNLPRSPVIADCVLNCREVLVSPLVAAEKVSTRRTTIRSPGQRAL